MKTKEEIETLHKKLAEITEEELSQVSGGNNTLEEIAKQAKQHFQLDGEETHDAVKAFLEKYGKYYKEILPKK